MFTSLLPYALMFSRIVTALVFALSGMGKLRDLSAFERAVANFRILPQGIVKVTASLFVAGELIVVVLMFLEGGFLLSGFLLAMFLLLLFSIALLSVLARKLQTSCNCFGPSTKPMSHYDVLRNVGLMVCAFIGWFALSTFPDGQAGLKVAEVVLLGPIAITCSVLWIKIGDLVELFHAS
jgi:uncharacterized membrane protein YphA (DoxX/SURF4 family)